MSKAKVLVACEESQVVCKAFREREYEAYSCDILDCSGGHPEWHIKDNVLNHLEGWDLIIAHPPCTYLANSGVRWLHERPERWKELKKAIDFFLKLLNAPCDRIAVENPVMHRYARERIPPPTLYIQPYQFGDPISKKTGLWLKNLPPLVPTRIIPKEEVRQKIWLEPPSAERSRKRSKTFQGIAEAMADQWGKLLRDGGERMSRRVWLCRNCSHLCYDTLTDEWYCGREQCIFEEGEE